MNSGISQPIILDKYIGKYATLVIYTDINRPIAYCSGILTPSIEWTSIATSSKNECGITCSNKVFQCDIYTPCKFAALYIGQYDVTTLPNYSPKGYGVELAECQRYYQQYINIFCDVINTIDTHINNIPFFFAKPFRIKPTVNITASAWVDNNWIHEANVSIECTETACRIYFSLSAYTATHIFSVYASADL